MSELRAGAKVEGTDGHLGEVDALIIDPTTEVVTHLVVTHHRLDPRLLVPVDHVVDAAPDRIALDLSGEQLEGCTRFDEPAFVAGDDTWAYGNVVLDPGMYFLEPFATPVDGWPMTDYERIPRGELAFRRGTAVHSADGTKVGHLDEFLVDPADGHVTHLVLRQGHLLRHDDDVVIPMSHAQLVEDSVIRLDLTVDEVAALPHVPVKRHAHVRDAALPEPAED